MIDMTEWANGHRGFPAELFACLMVALGIFAACVVLLKLGHHVRLRMGKHPSDDVKPLMDDEGFLVALLLAVACGVWTALPSNTAILTTPRNTFSQQVAQQAGLKSLSCPFIGDSDYMPGQGRQECEYVDSKGQAHDMSLLVTSGDKVWLYDHNGKPMKVTAK